MVAQVVAVVLVLQEVLVEQEIFLLHHLAKETTAVLEQTHLVVVAVVVLQEVALPEQHRRQQGAQAVMAFKARLMPLVLVGLALAVHHLQVTSLAGVVEVNTLMAVLEVMAVAAQAEVVAVLVLLAQQIRVVVAEVVAEPEMAALAAPALSF